MTALEFVKNIRTLRKIIDCKKQKVEIQREIATNTSATLTGMPRNPSASKSPMADAVCKIIDLEAEILVLEQERKEAITFLNRLGDTEYCNVLLLRYAQEKTWEDIALEMCYCRAQVFKIHNAALAQLEEILKV